jgi:hypothetical protein
METHVFEAIENNVFGRLHLDVDRAGCRKQTHLFLDGREPRRHCRSRIHAGSCQRLANRVQLTTDGHASYLEAVDNAFGSNIDFGQLVKLYGVTQEPETRYSPADCIGARKNPVTGNPDPKHISTSFVERQNLTMRMCMRRFTRLTNGFSERLDNHVAAIALHFMYYNFVRIHPLRTTPAMAAGVADRLWEVADIVKLVEEREGTVHEAKIERRFDRGPALGHKI